MERGTVDEIGLFDKICWPESVPLIIDGSALTLPTDKFEELCSTFLCIERKTR